MLMLSRSVMRTSRLYKLTGMNTWLTRVIGLSRARVSRKGMYSRHPIRSTRNRIYAFQIRVDVIRPIAGTATLIVDELNLGFVDRDCPLQSHHDGIPLTFLTTSVVIVPSSVFLLFVTPVFFYTGVKYWWVMSTNLRRRRNVGILAALVVATVILLMSGVLWLRGQGQPLIVEVAYGTLVLVAALILYDQLLVR